MLVGLDVGRFNRLMKIGQLAKKTDVSMRTIRYYEELRLISPTGRSKGGFRLYDEEVLSRIRLIQSLQELELSLREIKALMALRENNKTRGEVARTLVSRLRSHCVEAERKRAIYQTIVHDFDEGMKILSECQDCPHPCNEPHCGKHRIFDSEDLPSVVRSLF